MGSMRALLPYGRQMDPMRIRGSLPNTIQYNTIDRQATALSFYFHLFSIFRKGRDSTMADNVRSPVVEVSFPVNTTVITYKG